MWLHVVQVSEAQTLGNADLKTLDMDVSPGVLEVSLLCSDTVLEEVIFIIVPYWDSLYHHLGQQIHGISLFL